MSDDILDSLWIEKYRPKKLDDVVLTDEHRKVLSKCIESAEIPHLLLAGPPGSGKTTSARIIVDAITKSEMDYFPLNGSDSTGVDVIRSDIQDFLKSPPFKSKIKIVFIDEFDYMSQNAQAAMRNIMEKYADNGRFICTCNYLSKVIDPLQSRFQTFQMKSISEEFAIKYCEGILTKENVEYDKDTVTMIVKNLLPDVRKIVGTLQQNTFEKKLKKLDVASIASTEKKLCSYIIQICDDMMTERKDKTINQNISQIQKLVNNDLDFKEIYQLLFFQDTLPLWAKIKVNSYNNAQHSSAVPAIHFMACVYDIVQTGINFSKTFVMHK